MRLEACVDCKCKDYINIEYSGLSEFGDDLYICVVCAKARGIEDVIY